MNFVLQRVLWMSVTIAIVATVPHVHAQEYSATAITQRPVPATNREDATASGTAIETHDRPLALESVSEALREAPGTRIQQLGGFGSFSGLSLRGADTGHTTVLLGNLPLDTIDEGAFDFSLLPLGLFERVVVYRGGAPAWLGEGSIGGVVQLVPSTARDKRVQASVGGGSFGRYQLGLDTRVAGARGVTLQTHAALDGATNDFGYRDPGGALIGGDEHDRRTQNAQVTQGNLLIHAGAPFAGGQIELVWMGVGRTAGIPGPQRAPSPSAHRQLVRTNVAVGYTFSNARNAAHVTRLQLLVGGGYQVNRVSDRGQIGTTFFAETDDRWSNLFARAAGSIAITRALDLTAVTSMRLDTLAPENILAHRAPPRPSHRTSEIGTLEARLHGSVAGAQSELRGSARVQLSQTSVQTTRTTDSDVIDVASVTPTFRVAAVTAPLRWLSVGASVARGQRLPTFGELFGDRAFLQPNPELKPERSLSADLSATVLGHAGLACLQLEVRAFHLAIEDFITYMRSARFDAKPENMGYVTINGAEIGSKLSYGEHANFTLSATAMDSRTALGHQAPNRPNLILYARPEVSFGVGGWFSRATLFADLNIVSFNHTDAANLAVIPGRQWVGLGAALRLLDGQAELQVRASNLLDQESEDLNGFALPGRALLASLTIQEEL